MEALGVRDWNGRVKLSGEIRNALTYRTTARISRGRAAQNASTNVRSICGTGEEAGRRSRPEATGTS